VDHEHALELQRAAIQAWIRTLAGIVTDGELLERDGVVAVVAPRAPKRSLLNGAIHSGAASLERALPELTEAYDRAGVAATMWTIEPDPAAEALLEEAGYALDGEPAAMFADLNELPAADPGDLDWDASATAEELGRVNDLAYGYPYDEGVSAGIGEPAGLAPRSYRARVGGEVASVLQTADVGSDCLIMWVATLAEHRGRRLTSRLLEVALRDARERGMRTTSLQASMLGRGVYERLGYELVASLRLHERRIGSGA